MSLLLLFCVDLIAVLTIVWVVQLVRRDRLYVGYGVMFVIAVVVGALAMTVPVVLPPVQLTTDLLQRPVLFLGSALAFLLLILIYIMSQLTIIANRVTTLTQEIAIRDAMRTGLSSSPPGERTSAPFGAHRSDQPSR